MCVCVKWFVFLAFQSQILSDLACLRSPTILQLVTSLNAFDRHVSLQKSKAASASNIVLSQLGQNYGMQMGHVGNLQGARPALR